MKILQNVFNTGRSAAVTEEPALVGKSEVEFTYVQSDIKYPGTSSDSNILLLKGFKNKKEP